MENSHTVKTCFEGEIVFEGSVTLKKSGQACMENRLSRHIFMDKKKKLPKEMKFKI